MHKNIFKMIIVAFLNIGIFISLGWTKEAKYEKASSIITNYAVNNSTTKSLSLDLINTKGSISWGEINKLNSYCRNFNIYKTYGDIYSFRLVFGNSDPYFTYSFNPDFNYSFLPFHTSGTHKNRLNENVFDWYEVKVMFPHVDNNIDYSKCNSFIELRQKDADIILDSLGKTHTQENYKWLVDNKFVVEAAYSKSKAPALFQVDNIILDHQGNDLYFEKLYGNYCLFYPNNLPSYDEYSVVFDFGSSLVETKNYLKMIENEFSTDQYKISINSNNAIDIKKVSSIESSIKESFMALKTSSSKDWLFYFTSAVFGVFEIILFSLILFREKRPFWYLLIPVSSYFFFFLLDKINPSLFSSFFSIPSLLINVFVLLYFVAGAFIRLRKQYDTNYFSIDI